MWLAWTLSETMKIIVGAIVIAVMAVGYWEKRRMRKLDDADRFAAHMAPNPDAESPVERPNADSRLPAILQAARRESWRTTDPAQLRRLNRRRVVFELVGLVCSLLLFYMLLSLLFKW